MIRKGRYRESSKYRVGEGPLVLSCKCVMLGSLVIFGSILTLGVVVGVVVLVISEILGLPNDAVSKDPSLVCISLTVLLAFFLVGFVAGRMASRAGLKHGHLVALLTLVAAM